MLSKKIVTMATLASVLSFAPITSIYAQSVTAEEIKSGNSSSISIAPANNNMNLKHSSRVIATYSPERKEKLLNALTDVKLNEIKSVEALTERLGDQKLIEAFKQDVGVSNTTDRRINWKKWLRAIAQIILILTAPPSPAPSAP